MDDDLLADDGQFKDDGLDDLDIDQEAALLGLSDEENELNKHSNDQELEYVDEEGNPVDIGGNNAELYELAPENKSFSQDDDVLEVDLDTELDSFIQEDVELNRESPVVKSSKIITSDNKRVISLSTRREFDKMPARNKEAFKSLEVEKKKEVFVPRITRPGKRPTFNDDESEDESVGDDHRERFKSERNIITLTPVKRRADIPDTLDSVIPIEETEKVQAFLENEQKRKMRWKNRRPIRENNYSRAPQPEHTYTPPVQHTQVSQMTYHSTTHQVSQSAAIPTTVPRKILINPHFRGPRMPPAVPTEQVHYQPQDAQMPSYQVPYEDPHANYVQPQYSNPEPVHQITVPPPNYTNPAPVYAPPPPIPPPEYIPQHSAPQNIPQIPVWQNTQTSAPPPMSYSNAPSYPEPPPTYSNSYQPPNYQNPPMYQTPPPPVPHSMVYQPEPVHQVNYQVTPSYPSTVTTVPPPPPQYTVPSHHQQPQPQQQNNTVQQSSYIPHLSRHPQQQPQRSNFVQNQRYNRQPEKRSGNMNFKGVPKKQPRMEHNPRKVNHHVNSSNIREIPLIDTVSLVQKAAEPPPATENEDDYNRELKERLELQKKVREEIFRRKEERRKQMAAKRLEDLQKRKLEQQAQENKENPVDKVAEMAAGIGKNASIFKNRVKGALAGPKGIVQAPVKQGVVQPKKKIVVVRKKVPQPGNQLPSSETNKIQRPQQLSNLVRKPSGQLSMNPMMKPAAAKLGGMQQPKVSIQPPSTTPQPNKTTPQTAKPTPAQKEVANKLNIAQQKVKLARMQTLKNRPQDNRVVFHRGPQCSPSPQRFPRMMEPPYRHVSTPFPPDHPRMRFHPMDDVRMPFPPRFGPPQPHFFPPPPELTPPRGPHFQFPHPRFDGPRHPHSMDMFPPDRMPPPPHVPFPNRPPQFQQWGFQRGRQQFRPRGEPPKGNVKSRLQMAPDGQPTAQIIKTGQSAMKPGIKATTVKLGMKSTPVQKRIGNTDAEASRQPKTQCVKVENLSSSTDEKQLKKLASTVGAIESIQLFKQERNAVIKFKEAGQAVNFQTKYQRHMLDLAMIRVTLL